MIEHNSEVYNHPYISFSLYMYIWKKISVGVIVCLIIPLVSLLIAVLVSLHPATFLMFFITCGNRIMHQQPISNTQFPEWRGSGLTVPEGEGLLYTAARSDMPYLAIN